MPDYRYTSHDSVPKTNGDHTRTKMTEPDVRRLVPRWSRNLREYLLRYVGRRTGRNRPVRDVRLRWHWPRWVLSRSPG